MKIIEIIKKNLKILLRSKSSALIILLGPLLIMLFSGVAFNTNTGEKVNVGVYSNSYSELTNSFIASFNDEETLLEKFASEEKCIEAVRTGFMHTCITFPEGFSLEKEGTETITLYVDYSKINLVRIVLDKISEKIANQSSHLSTELTNILLYNIDLTQEEVAKISKLLIDLQTENSLMKQEVGQSKSQLDSLDLTFDSEDFDINDLKSSINDMEAYCVDVKNKGEDVVSIAEDFADSIPSGCECVNSSVITNFESEIANYSSKIVLSYGSFEDELDKADEIAGDLESQIEDIDSRFLSIAQSRQVVSQNSQVVGNTLDTSLKNIEDVSASKNRILKSISNIKITEAGEIVTPVKTKIEKVTTKENTRLDYLFPNLIVLIIMFISILFATTSMVVERNSRAFFRNFLTPTRDYIFTLGAYLTNMLLLLLQGFIVLLLAGAVFKAPIIENIGGVLLLLFILSTLFVFIGIFLGSIFKTQESAILGAISIGSIFLLISDFILPLESMSPIVQEIARYNPFILGSDLLRKILLLGSSLADVQYDIYILIGSCAIVVLFTFGIRHLAQTKLLHKGYEHLMSKGKKKDKLL